MLTLDVIRETLTSINSRHDASDLIGVAFDSHSGRGLATVADLGGRRRLPFAVVNGVVEFRGSSYRPTMF